MPIKERALLGKKCLIHLLAPQTGHCFWQAARNVRIEFPARLVHFDEIAQNKIRPRLLRTRDERTEPVAGNVIVAVHKRQPLSLCGGHPAEAGCKQAAVFPVRDDAHPPVPGGIGRENARAPVAAGVVDADELKQAAFENTFLKSGSDLYDISVRFLQGKQLEGILIGGNIRCLLKLAGTQYWPDMSGKVLLLEALGGDVPKMATYLSQLNQLHVFDQISGVLLGTFTEMEKNGYSPSVEELIKQYVNEKTPVAKTWEIGHGKDAKAVRIGAEIVLDSRQVDKNGKQCG